MSFMWSFKPHHSCMTITAFADGLSGMATYAVVAPFAVSNDRFSVLIRNLLRQNSMNNQIIAKSADHGVAPLMQSGLTMAPSKEKIFVSFIQKCVVHVLICLWIDDTGFGSGLGLR